MASNRPAHDPWFESNAFTPRDGCLPAAGHVPTNSPRLAPVDARTPLDEPATAEWNPTTESLAPVRGRHRVVKQRGGGAARSGAVLGVGVIAAVGAGGMATANQKPPVSISMPDLAEVKHTFSEAKSLPGIGSLVSDDSSGRETRDVAAPISQAGAAGGGSAQGANAGEVLRARIMRQAEQQQGAVDRADREAAARSAAEKAAHEAAAKKAKADAAKKKAAEEAKRKAEAERIAKLAAGYIVPVASYTLTSGFGEAGSLWANDHTGQDFAAPTGTPARAVHGGTVTQAGWAGSYGYRIVLTLDDGTEVWYCHLSSMVKTSGKVAKGETIGRVGATGNVTGPHLHLEIRPGGGNPIDPLGWLRGVGLSV